MKAQTISEAGRENMLIIIVIIIVVPTLKYHSGTKSSKLPLKNPKTGFFVSLAFTTKIINP